jgi:hypothetical protein
MGLLCIQPLGLMAQAQTFSPYTPAQLQELNSLPLSPAEGPMGPVDPGSMQNQQRPSFDSRYIHNPEGEEQAEGQGLESAAPYEPIPSTFIF